MKNNPNNQFKQLSYGQKNLSYIYSNPHKHKKIVVFVHGSPGSWKSFSQYLSNPQLQEVFGLLVVDRPGYGQFISQGPEESLAVQAKMLNAILEKHFDSSYSITLLGHSYGGPLIAKMALTLGDTLNIDTLYFLAASLDPNLEKTKWFQYPAQWQVFQWFIPKPLIHCNEEILHLKQDLVSMKPELKQLAKKNILILHGKKDNLVPVENVTYMQKHMSVPNANITLLDDTNHFIPWSNHDLIVKTLLMVAEKKNI
ncbi:alpha/beta hydrolase [bacterium]|nr:alpha/beta hydrolase [bacterium]